MECQVPAKVRPSLRSTEVGLTARAILVAVSAMAAVGLFLLSRWLVGAFHSELSWWLLAAMGLTLGALIRFSRDLWRASQPLARERATWEEQLVGWCPSVALILVAVTVSYPGERNIEWLVWLPLLVLDQFWRQTFFDGGRPIVDAIAPSTEDPRRPHPGDTTFPAASPTPTQSFLQQLSRSRFDSGEEIIAGTLLAEFQPRQRNAALHVAFCPPFDVVPLVEAAPIEGPPATVKPAQILTHGARFDVRLQQPAAESVCVVVDFAAGEPCATNGGRSGR